jgi:AdoMet-dependent heme synthase
MIDRDVQESLDKIILKAEEKKIPLAAHIDITYRCNLNCVHCCCRDLSEDFTRGQPEMPAAMIRRVLDELAEMNSFYLSISGGEALTHPDFFEIIRHARKRNFCITLITNGTLINEDVAVRLEEISLRSVQMSLYGTTPEVHDAITRIQGSFAKTTEAVKILKKHKIRIILMSVIMEQNIHQAAEISKFALGLGADEHGLNVEISRKNDGSVSPQRYQITAEKIRDLFSKTGAALPKGALDIPEDPLTKSLCGAGKISCYISPYGDIYPCVQLLVPMGNTNEKSFREIWRAPSRLRTELDSLKAYLDMPACRSCDYVKACRKCIGLAELETGDMKKCYKTLKSISKIEYELQLKQEV